MTKINVLDCTLRDGGYINNWEFGKEAIRNISIEIIDSNVEIVELGFLKNEPRNEDRTVFNSMEDVKKIIGHKKENVSYAVMCEVVNPLPLEMLTEYDVESADIIRVIVWKTKHLKDGTEIDALDEGFKYCKGIVEKGYKLCVQPARVDQYSDKEFIDMVKKFSKLDPFALYIVDSWGTQNPEQLLHYMHLADENMPQNVKLGYHGHNNMMQALSTSQFMIKEGFDRDLVIDASVYGIGRGAGNLNIELITKYLNENYDKNYKPSNYINIYEKYIKLIYDREKWGYSIQYYLTATYNCNPAYARHFINIPPDKMEVILKRMNKTDKVIYSKEKGDRYLAEIK